MGVQVTGITVTVTTFYHFGRRALATHGFSSFPRDAPADPLYSYMHVKENDMRITLALLFLLTGCASDWTRTDTFNEVTWQVLNVVDAKQTANIQHHPGVYEADPLSRKLLGLHPSTSGSYQVMATYALSHYLISAALPPRYRKWWFAGTGAYKAAIVYENHKRGL